MSVARKKAKRGAKTPVTVSAAPRGDGSDGMIHVRFVASNVPIDAVADVNRKSAGQSSRMVTSEATPCLFVTSTRKVMASPGLTDAPRVVFVTERSTCEVRKWATRRDGALVEKGNGFARR